MWSRTNTTVVRIADKEPFCGICFLNAGNKKTVCLDENHFHQNKLFFIFTLIIFSEHSYFLRKSQITPERKQRKKYFLTPFALPWNIQTARKAFIYGLFRNLVLSLRTPTLHFFSKLTCKNFLFRRFRDTALFFFPFLSGLKKPCIRMFSDARLLIFFSMFLCLFLMFSQVLRMARIF